jgi:hypothetical protein
MESELSKNNNDSKSHSSAAANIQCKLAVGSVNDSMEAQADAVADQVMRLPANGIVQRKCSKCEEEEKAQRKPITSFIQKKEASGNTSIASDAVSNKIQETKGSGASLDTPTKNFMESRFGTDFSGVRIHTDSQAVALSSELNAQAFTVGNDVYFNTGKYSPESSEGKHLLAHELTHVVQQGTDLQRKQIQRRVIDANVVTTQPMLTRLGLTRQEVIDAIRDADTDAIQLAQNAEDTLTTQLANAVAGNPVDANAELILNEELGLSFNNVAHRGLIRQQIQRFVRVRATLQSGYLRYMGLGIGNVSLVGCQTGNCGNDFAFSCPGNRLIVLCQTFWDTPDEQGATLLHEPFHIWFHMARHEVDALRRADASCFESFALRVSGRAAPPSCAAHTNG